MWLLWLLWLLWLRADPRGHVRRAARHATREAVAALHEQRRADDAVAVDARGERRGAAVPQPIERVHLASDAGAPLALVRELERARVAAIRSMVRLKPAVRSAGVEPGRAQRFANAGVIGVLGVVSAVGSQQQALRLGVALQRAREVLLRRLAALVRVAPGAVELPARRHLRVTHRWWRCGRGDVRVRVRVVRQQQPQQP